ncbi:MFS transporter [Streptomyces sp. NPDC055400]
MPLAVYVLGLAVFALGTSEFMLSGILPAIADDMDVTIPQAGLLISAFALGMVAGAPLLAVATLRLPRRTTLIALISVFGLGQVTGALAPTYAVLFASRIVSALACAGFWAVGAAVAIGLVPVTQRARAMAVMTGGLSIANVLGVPAGAFLGDGLGWRAAFWAVGAASAIALVGVVLSFLMGFSAFYTAPALNARMFNVAGAAPALAGATTTAASTKVIATSTKTGLNCPPQDAPSASAAPPR